MPFISSNLTLFCDLEQNTMSVTDENTVDRRRSRTVAVSSWGKYLWMALISVLKSKVMLVRLGQATVFRKLGTHAALRNSDSEGSVEITRVLRFGLVLRAQIA
jgi:hypothetical protein